MAGAGYGISDGAGGFVTKLESDGDAKIGDSSGDVLQITGSVEQLGTSLKISGDDARIKINGDTDSHPGLEFLENGSRHWIVYNDYTTDNLTFKSSADRVVITDAGRLGIGTTSPDYKLDVAGNISLNEHIYHNGDPNTRFSFPNPDEINIVAGGNSVLKFESNTILLNNSNQNFDTKVMADNGQVVLHVDAGTNRVGIGTTSPNYALDVAGNIGVDQYIYHNGDDNTFISFTDDDINIQAGGVNFIDITEDTQNEITFNEAGADIDFRVEGDTDTHLLFVEGGTDRVGIGTSSPSVTLDVAGDVNFDGSAVFNESSADKDFRVESNHNTHMFYIDGGSNRIGIGNNSPQTVLDITDPLDAITGAEVDAIIRLRSKRDVGIKLIADTANTTGETDNPFIDYYADSLTDATGRGNRLASMALEGTAGTTFTDSLAGAYFLDAFCPNHTPSPLRPFQIANDSSNNGHKARITIEGTNGYVGVWTNTPSHALEVNGNTKSNYYITTPSTQDLGNGTSSTLSIGSSLMFLDADSITGAFHAQMGMDVHTLNLPNGTTSGQRLTLVIEGNMGAADNMPIMLAGNLLGAIDMFIPTAKTSLNFVYYSTAAISAWYQV